MQVHLWVFQAPMNRHRHSPPSSERYNDALTEGLPLQAMVLSMPEVYESKVLLEFTKNPRALFQEARQLVPRSSRIVHARKRRSQPATLRFSHGQPASLLSGLKSTSYANCFRKRFRIDAQRTASIHPLLKEGPAPYHTLKPVCKPRE